MSSEQIEISNNLNKVKQTLPEKVCLVAVSKTKPSELIHQAYQAGQRDFGENKIQEMCEKYDELPKDIRWHMIGHIQRNKVKYMAPFVHLIHGVDSLRLLEEINKRALQNNRIIPCLLQIHIAEETTKFGFSFQEISSFFTEEQYKNYPNVQIKGFMGMGTNGVSESQTRMEFAKLKKCFDKTNHTYPIDTLSIGMSNDYTLAIQEGSNMVRIGSAIFGKRNYPTVNQ